tara:strand:+ start:10332 stop:11843 length:1512 start_codon:yes stop_codon:yes gene_type:complete
MKNKILDIKKINYLRKKKPNLKIGLAHGVFDLLHFGHIKHLQSAKNNCDVLIVSITSAKFVKKGPERPYYTDQERLNFLSTLEFVDYVSLSKEDTGKKIIEELKPNFYFKGNEYEIKSNDITNKIKDEIKVLKKNKGKIFYTNEKTLSSSNLINRFFLKSDDKKKTLIDINKKFNFNEIKKDFDKISNLKVLVIGDLIIDRYYFCETLGKSPKEDLISVKNQEEETYGGGIIATANHISDFVKNITLLSSVGENKKNKNYLKFINQKIKQKIYYVAGSATIEKNRYLEISSKRKLFQNLTNDFIRIDKKLESKILSYLNKNIKKYDLVLVNDFGHGLLTEKIRNLIQKKSNYLALNCQTNSSNVGYNFISKYKFADHVTIDEPEARLSTQKRFAPISSVIKALKKQIKFKTCSITRGENGSVVLEYKSKKYFNCPVLSEKVEDTLGAGDSYFALSSLFANIKKNLELVGFIGNVSGALKISYLGHRKYIKKINVLSFIKSLMA